MLENTPEGRVVSLLPLRTMKKEMKDRKRERKEMKENVNCQDLQKHLKEGRKERWNQGKRKMKKR